MLKKKRITNIFVVNLSLSAFMSHVPVKLVKTIIVANPAVHGVQLRTNLIFFNESFFLLI